VRLGCALVWPRPRSACRSVHEPVEQPARPDDLGVDRSDPLGQFPVGRNHDHLAIGLGMAAIVSSPTPGACTTSTPSTFASSAPARARPSSTRVTGGSSRPPVTVDRTRSVKRRAAPDRSRLQPVGRDPITLATSITNIRTVWRLPRSPEEVLRRAHVREEGDARRSHRGARPRHPCHSAQRIPAQNSWRLAPQMAPQNPRNPLDRFMSLRVV
jgi:hypothetical protein